MSCRATVVVLPVAALVAAAALSCAGPGIQTQADVVRSDIEKARKSGAYQCAPRELAMAETAVDFAENELAQGDFMRARQHIDAAVQNANAALANSKECAPKRVLIKTRTDKDADGIIDDKDACPEQPEDRDLFEDEDGCPDPDNDGDSVLDPLDRCVNTPGPAENEGCPYGDTDKDGIDDKNDACPEAPEDKDGDRDTDGRPDLDADKDGVEDCVTGCPLPSPGNDDAGKPLPAPPCDACLTGAPDLVQEDKDGFEDEDGCPEVDNDKDGLLDKVDACPNEAGPPENRGCPIRDKDGDGFTDQKDACPEVAGIRWPNNPEKDGCPRLDSDGDGFFDDEDACPIKPGVAWPDEPKKNGCPPKLTLVEVTDNEIKIKQQVQFDTGKSTIKPVSAKLLAEVGLVIRQSQNIKKVRVLGHTDDVGDDDSNMTLSQGRANSVRQWLVDKEKVDPDRLEAEGFGETQPIASNRTKTGRQQNRRVEFKVERAVKVQQVIEPDVAPKKQGP